jgi:hypothetical protein
VQNLEKVLKYTEETRQLKESRKIYPEIIERERKMVQEQKR